MKDQEPRITIAEVFRRIKEVISSDTSQRFPDSVNVYVKNGAAIEAALQKGEEPEDEQFFAEAVDGKAAAIQKLKVDFQAYCVATLVKPIPLHMPWGGPPYSGAAIDDYEYDISFSEYEAWAARYLRKTTHLQFEKQTVESSPARHSPAITPAIGQGEPEGIEDEMSDLFEPVKPEILEKMFPSDGEWKNWAERAKRNGLSSARDGRGLFNPYRAALWFLKQGRPGWDIARCNRVLVNNLPARSRHEGHLLGER